MVGRCKRGIEKGKYYVSGDAILAQTVCPEKGQAVKEAFFTQSVKGDVYAILPVLKSGKFVLKNIQSTNNTRISMLGLNKTLLWKQKAKTLRLQFLSLNMEKLHAIMRGRSRWRM